MHTLNLNDTGAKVLGIPPGRVLCEDANASEILIRRWGSELRHVLTARPDLKRTDRVLIIRPGGFGDILMLTRVLEVMAQKYARVGVACFNQLRPVLENLPFHIETVQYPLPLEELENWDAIICLEHLVEDKKDEQAVAIFARECGLATTEYREGGSIIPLYHTVPIYIPTEQELSDATEKFPRQKGEKRIGIQVRASAECRSYPFQFLTKVIQRLLNDMWTVHLFGDPGSWHSQPRERLVNHTLPDLERMQGAPTFRQSAALLSLCDVALVPDSAFAHLAPALGVPTVALYGPFAAGTRLAGYPLIRVLQGVAECAPCAHHVRGGQEYPHGCPTGNRGFCAAMASIPPGEVVKQAKEMLAFSKYQQPA